MSLRKDTINVHFGKTTELEKSKETQDESGSPSVIAFVVSLFIEGFFTLHNNSLQIAIHIKSSFIDPTRPNLQLSAAMLLLYVDE